MLRNFSNFKKKLCHVLFFLFLNNRFKQLKHEYMNRKSDVGDTFLKLEAEFFLLSQFFEPKVELRLSPDHYLVAQTQIKQHDNPQPDIIQLCVGILSVDQSNYEELKSKAESMIQKELLGRYPEIYN